MLWLEPLVEVETAEWRVAYGPVQASDVSELVQNGMLDGAQLPLSHGQTEDIAWLAGQQRLTFARVGVIDPLSAASYQEHGGITGLRKALELTPEEVVERLEAIVRAKSEFRTQNAEFRKH